MIEPRSAMLKQPTDEQLIYKIMSAENLIQSIAGSYLHFNRIDNYTDFPGADLHDGKQLPKDKQGNAGSKFEKNPNFSASDCYDKSRKRTYACCFSLENSDFIWKNYASNTKKGKICVIFECGKLRKKLNQTFRSAIFNLNYGVVEYVKWEEYQANAERLPNPIKYTYLKSVKYALEREFRISLSAFGIGGYVLKDGSPMNFEPSFKLFFDFKSAIADETIREILYAPDCDSNFLILELQKLGIQKL